MWALGPLAFANPWLLLGLPLLPILWILLRTVPPAPVRRLFPGVALLLGLTDDEVQTDRTPWWLLLLRMLAVCGCHRRVCRSCPDPSSGHGSRRTAVVVVRRQLGGCA